jgi:predicted dehydrogenase
VASRDLERARAFGEPRGIPEAYGSYQHLLEDAEVDVVYVAAPNSEHVGLAHAAIDHGKHVLIEKPMAMTAADVVALGDHARMRGVFLMEAMWSRFLPQSTIIAQLLSDGALGELRSATADFSSRVPFDPTNRVYDPALGGGCLADLGVYASWFVQFVLGPALSVVARGHVAPTGVEDEAVVVSEHADGAVGVATSSLRAAGVHRATVVGERPRPLRFGRRPDDHAPSP